MLTSGSYEPAKFAGLLSKICINIFFMKQLMLSPRSSGANKYFLSYWLMANKLQDNISYIFGSFAKFLHQIT